MFGLVDGQRRGDARVVQHLDQEEPRAALHQLRRRRALLHPHAALGTDVHRRQHAAIEDLLQPRTAAASSVIADRLVERL